MGAEQSTMKCGELLAGCMPPPRSMYDAKKTDAYQPDSEAQPLHRMKARANAVSVSGDGNGHTIMLAPGVEFIAKHKVDEMCDMFHEVMKDVWVRLGDLRTENGDLKRTVKELAGLVAVHETGEAPGDWGADFTKTATAGSVNVDAAADGRAIGSPSLARDRGGTPSTNGGFTLRTPTGDAFASPMAVESEALRTPLSLSTPAGMQALLKTLSPPDGRGPLTPEQIFPQMKGDHQVELVERGWLELAVENLMAKNDALNRRVEELSRHALGDQEATLLAEEAAARLHKENCELKLQRDMLQHRVQAMEESLQETMGLLDDERRDHDNDQRSWASSLAERELQVATLQVELKRLKAATPSPQANTKRRTPKKVSPAAAAATKAAAEAQRRRKGTTHLNPMLTTMAAAHDLLASIHIPGLSSPRLFGGSKLVEAEGKTTVASPFAFVDAVKPPTHTFAPSARDDATPRSTLDSPVPPPPRTPRLQAALDDVSNTTTAGSALRRRNAANNKRKEVPLHTMSEDLSPTMAFGSMGLDSMGIPYSAY